MQKVVFLFRVFWLALYYTSWIISSTFFNNFFAMYTVQACTLYRRVHCTGCLKRSLYFLQHLPLNLGSKRGFYTNCLSPQAYFRNALFHLYPTKSILRPTSGHWIFHYIALWKALNKKEADSTIFANRFFIIFCTDAFNENSHIYSFPWIKI